MSKPQRVAVVRLGSAERGRAMSKYRAGQRVRIEWPDGHVLEGLVQLVNGHPFVRAPLGLDKYWLDRDHEAPTVTTLSEPRPDEPTGLGAVVEASALPILGGEPVSRRRWVLSEGWTWHAVRMEPRKWTDLIDPVVLSEGWTPDE